MATQTEAAIASGELESTGQSQSAIANLALAPVFL